MSSILDSKALIKSIKRRSFIPNDQSTFTDTDFLEMASEEIQLGLMEKVIEARGNYLVYHVDVPIVPEQSVYYIPSRAYGNKLRELCLTDDNGNVITDLKQIDIEDLSYSTQMMYLNSDASLFYLENDKVTVSPLIAVPNRNLRMYFYMRPSKLVLNERAGVISSIGTGFELVNSVNTPVTILAFATLPKHFSNLINYDIVSPKLSNKITNYSLTPVTVNTNAKTVSFLTSDIIELVQAGDYLTQEEETIIPNLPTVFHPIVAQRTARACLEAMNDDAGYAKASSKLAEMEEAVLKIITDRVEGSPKKIKNRGGTLRNGINKNLNRKW